MFSEILNAIAEEFGFENELQSRNCISYEEIENCILATQEEIEVW